MLIIPQYVKKFPRSFWNLQFHYSIQRYPSLVAVPSQMNPVPNGQLLSSEISAETFESMLRKTRPPDLRQNSVDLLSTGISGKVTVQNFVHWIRYVWLLCKST